MIDSSKLAVCSWSLQPKTPADLLQQTAATGIKRLQLNLDPLRDDPAVWSSLPELCEGQGVTFVSGMFGTVGEDYTSMETIKQTGGIVPDRHWPKNWENIQQTVKLAKQLRLKLVTFHAGFLPHEPSDPNFKKLLARVTQIAELFAAENIDLGFETGQETAETLSTFLKLLDKKNVGVNFDPANMILYNQPDPIAALRHLAPWLKQCHIKDATRTRTPGTWGEEVVTGTGQVDWPAFFQTIKDIGYQGDFAIEREAGQQRIADIKAARLFLNSYFS